MNLFNRKTLNRHVQADPIPDNHRVLLEEWSELIASRRIEALKETALREDFGSKIVKGVLGYRGPSSGATYTLSTEQAILAGSVDLVH